MVRETSQQRANGDLRDLVSTFGCAQYLLVPASLMASLGLLSSRGSPPRTRVFGGACAAIGLACGAVMLYRGYLSSLGG